MCLLNWRESQWPKGPLVIFVNKYMLDNHNVSRWQVGSTQISDVICHIWIWHRGEVLVYMGLRFLYQPRSGKRYTGQRLILVLFASQEGTLRHAPTYNSSGYLPTCTAVPCQAIKDKIFRSTSLH